MTDTEQALEARRQLGETPNGCGPAPVEWLVPDWIYTRACLAHDLSYIRGGTEEQRIDADVQFYSDMLRTVSHKASWWNRHFYKAIAWLYWKAVLAGGKLTWNYVDDGG